MISYNMSSFMIYAVHWHYFMSWTYVKYICHVNKLMQKNNDANKWCESAKLNHYTWNSFIKPKFTIFTKVFSGYSCTFFRFQTKVYVSPCPFWVTCSVFHLYPGLLYWPIICWWHLLQMLGHTEDVIVSDVCWF